ncbi:MAG: hypothetical protein J5I98_33090 [Phaeodactylibacter sp.]|nr:hypothetical protein [Phaeodactylibacter sp.]
MSKISWLVLYVSFVAIGIKDCKNKWLFDTGHYHKATQKLRESFHAMDSIALILDAADCELLDSLDGYREKYSELCGFMKKYDIETKELITVRNCVVKDEVIDLKKSARLKWFEAEFQQFDSLLANFSEEVKGYKSGLEACLREYNKCKELRKNKDNQAILDAAEALADLKNGQDILIWRDSARIVQKIRREYFRLASSPGASQFYKDLLLAMISDVQFILSHRQDNNLCNNAHIRWAELEKAYITGSHYCERHHLEEESLKKWERRADSAWVMQQVLASKGCAIYPRGCICEEAANYDSTAYIDNGTCIGCMDPLAVNYCPSAKKQEDFPCRYAACTQRCYAEVVKDVKAAFPKFREGVDELVEADSLCITDLCGCINECADNFNPAARIAAIPDTCKGEKCGCLDSTYVNYVLRAGSKYYDPTITVHEPDSCHNRGCTAPCAVNYDPSAVVDDTSCICKQITKLELEKEVIERGLEKAGLLFSPESLELEFKDSLDKALLRSGEVKFRQRGLDLVVETKFQKMRIQSGSDFEGIPLGEYRFRAVNELIDALMAFLNSQSAGLSASMLEVKIVGEADAHPIREGGLAFNNAHRSVNGEPYKKLGPGIDAGPAHLSDPGFDLSPDAGPVNLEENQSFHDNYTLAFLRAFIVKQKILDVAGVEVDEKKISIGAKVNAKKGGAYRRIGISMTLTGFYKEVLLAQKAGEVNQELLDYVYAIDFFDRNGYPAPERRYSSCPCYATSPSPVSEPE